MPDKKLDTIKAKFKLWVILHHDYIENHRTTWSLLFEFCDSCPSRKHWTCPNIIPARKENGKIVWIKNTKLTSESCIEWVKHV